MISKTKINSKLERKTSKEIVDTIIQSKKLKSWREIANMVSGPRRRQASLNLSQIDKETKEGDTVIIPGKVLSGGKVSKKIRIAALYFSKSAEKKLKEKKCEVVKIKDEIKINPGAKGLKVLR